MEAGTNPEARLRSILSLKDAAALFDSPRHRDICSMVFGEQVFPMIVAEVDAVTHRLDTMALELDKARKFYQWGQVHRA